MMSTSWLYAGTICELVHHVPLPWVKSDGPWMLHASSNQCRAHIPVELGHLNLVKIAVNPVEFTRNPVHSKTLWGGQTMLHNHLDPCHPWNNKQTGHINIKNNFA